MVYTHESMALEEAYDNLITNISLDSIDAFLKACWLIDDNQRFVGTTMERIIYAEGDQQEVYTRLERDIIGSVSSCVYSLPFQLESEAGSIDCRLIVIVLNSEFNVIYDSIATMKIIDKAIDGFNLFVFISQTGLHFGCSSLTAQGSSTDCMLSYVINEKTDWELFSDTLLHRNDSHNMYMFYSGIVSVIEDIKNCQAQEVEKAILFRLSDFEDMYDNDPLEDPQIDFEEFFSCDTNEQEEPPPNANDDWFEQEVESYMSELAVIKKSHINPLEMLFEAENALNIAEQSTLEEKGERSFETNDSMLDRKSVV